jgi:DNA-3-methyladenine glycosylase II
LLNNIRAIVSQQLSTKAAASIYRKFLQLFSNGYPTAEEILQIPDEVLRGVGLSYQKISYVQSIATAFATQQIDQNKIKTMSDEEVIAELTKIKGVGRWTAEMILIFTLRRPDVFSIGDLGLRNAIIKLYGITDQQEMLKLAESWSPYRSTACWYLWRSLENQPME